MTVSARLLHIYLAVHTWVGIGCGVMLFIAFYAGAFTMLAPEFNRWAEPSPIALQVPPAPIDALAQAFLPERPAQLDVVRLVLAEDQPGRGHFEYEDPHGRAWRATLDDAGQLRTRPAPAGAAGAFIDDVHRRGGLPLPMAVAEPVIGFVCLLYGLALVSGVVVLLPSLVKDLLVLRITRNAKRFWLDAHNLLGLTSLPFHLVIALTAAGFGLHDAVYDTQDATIHALAGAAATVRPPARPPVPPPGIVDSRDWQPPSVLVQRAATPSASFRPTELQYRGLAGGRAIVRVAGEDITGHTRSPRAGYVTLNPRTGQPLPGVSLLPHHQNAWEATLSGLFALHFGSFGGAPVRVAYVLLGLLGALLFYTGNLLWIETRQRRPAGAAAAPVPRHVRWVAALTVGLCLGAAIGLPLGVVALRWAASVGLGLAGVADLVFNAALAGGLLLALAKGAAWAGHRLTLAAAVATWLIPLTSLLSATTLLPALAKPHDAAALWIDALATLAGAALWALARWARRRSRQSPPPSVWREHDQRATEHTASCAANPSALEIRP